MEETTSSTATEPPMTSNTGGTEHDEETAPAVPVDQRVCIDLTSWPEALSAANL